MITFTETETEEARWGLVAVPQDKADQGFLNDNSPEGDLAYMELVLRQALEYAEDAHLPGIRALVLEGLKELDLAKQATQPPKGERELPRQEALPMALPVFLPKLYVVEGGTP